MSYFRTGISVTAGPVVIYELLTFPRFTYIQLSATAFGTFDRFEKVPVKTTTFRRKISLAPQEQAPTLYGTPHPLATTGRAGGTPQRA